MLQALLLALYAWKRLISPLLGPRCRFTPSCSDYAREALCKHGLLKGSAFSIWRLMRCQPWCDGGEEPVP